MSNKISVFEYATKSFLEKFDYYWKEAISQLEVVHPQLTVGNRLRPQICLWGYLSTLELDDIKEHDYSTVANIAVSIEMIHKASLLVDDWIDNDNERHGDPTFHLVYGPQMTVIFALNMIGNAMNRIEKTFSDGVILPHNFYLCLVTTIRTVCDMAKGALKELQLESNDKFDFEKIKEITQLETAEIIGNSMLLGYYTGAKDNISQDTVEIFKEIGEQCGYLFQVLNDLEAFVAPKQLIKHKGNLNLDYQSNKKNLAIAMLYKLANEQDKKRLVDADEETLLKCMKKYNIAETMYLEINQVFEDMLKLVDVNSKIDKSTLWCDGFKKFLLYVKKFAETRLK